jgi:uncharacterized protein YbaR (Trm112 family)
VNVELIDRLRCPNAHEETWLVAAASRTEHRRLIEATLGCPVCDAEFDVHDGRVMFGEVPATRAATPMPASEDEALRAAALLAVQEGGLYLLDGGWGSLAPALLELQAAQFLLVDPPSDIGADGGLNVLVGTGDRWPLAAATLQGIALDQGSSQRVAGAVRLLAPRGRLVAPAGADVPAGVTELARDDRHWVAEKVADIVTLGRARR